MANLFRTFSRMLSEREKAKPQVMKSVPRYNTSSVLDCKLQYYTTVKVTVSSNTSHLFFFQITNSQKVYFYLQIRLF